MNLLIARRSERSVWTLALGACAVLLAALIPAVATAVVPDKPNDLTAVRGANQPVIASLSWSPPENASVVRYRVVAGTSPTGPFVSSELVEDTRYDFARGLGGMEYYFFVTAISADGEESVAAMAGPVSAEWAESPHDAGPMGSSRCLTCHSVHNAGNSTLIRQELAADEPSAQCLGCHDGRVAGAANIASGTVDAFGLASGHSFDASATEATSVSGCSTCHDVHATKQDGRMLPAKQVNGVAVTSGVGQCLACHDAQNSWAADYPSTSEPTRDATGFPISGTWTGPDTYLSPSNPHRLIPETTQTVQSADPVRREQGDCRYCHTTHGSVNPYDGLRATYTVPTASTLASDQADGTSAALCYTCHGGTAPAGFSAVPGTDIKRHSTADATSSAGHTIMTDGGTLPVGAPLPCFECHNPHGSSRGNASQISDERGAGLATTSADGVRAFCFTCHTTSDSVAGWDSAESTYTPVPAHSEVVGLPRNGALLKLPVAEVAHSQADPRSCYECHGNDYGPAGRNVHNPASGLMQVPLADPSLTDTATTEPTGADAGSGEPDAGAVSTDTSTSTEGSAAVSPVPGAEETGQPLLMELSQTIARIFSALG